MITKQLFLRRQKLKNLYLKLKLDVVKELLEFILSSLTFFLLLEFYLAPKFFNLFCKILHLHGPRIEKLRSEFLTFCMSFLQRFDRKGDMSRWQIMDLAFKNMRGKKSRTFITVGGMSIGIGAIVLLLSIGYGTENLVKKKVATLNEIKQTDISTLNQKALPLNNSLLKDIEKNTKVKSILPLISVVGKIKYNNSQTDVVVYGAAEEYIKNSDIRLIDGEIYKSENNWVEEYTNLDLITHQNEKPLLSIYTDEKVLGDSTSAQEQILQELKNEGLEDLEIYSLVPELQESANLKTLELKMDKDKFLGNAVISDTLMEALNLNKETVIGSEITVDLDIMDDLIPGTSDKKLISNGNVYKVVGVVSDKNSNIYLPLTDLKTLGVKNYSQVKLVATQDTDIPEIRDYVRSKGLETQSVQDTLDRIETLFNTIRYALLLLGGMALAVASLGMFNTLTISLLERTHEVGLLKAIGMKSNEVKDLFMAESLLLGFFGGVVGVLLGFFVGKILDTIISIVSILSGQGILILTYIPLGLTLFVLALSFFIGLVTGYYPSKRATKISALDALRYE